MMTIMRMRSAILTIAYCISAIFQASEITAVFGKIIAINISGGDLKERSPQKRQVMADPAWIGQS